jgi:predicted small metal-binding protein
MPKQPKEEARGDTAMASFRCKDIGERCSFEVKDENRDELIWVVALHAEETHSMRRSQPEMMDKIKKAVKK